MGAPWGSTPILDDTGQQCTSHSAVDAAVRGYWVDCVLRRHASVDEESAWAAFRASRFGSHIPCLQWPQLPWTGDRVRQVLRQMREGASPGHLGIPIGVLAESPGCVDVLCG